MTKQAKETPAPVVDANDDPFAGKSVTPTGPRPPRPAGETLVSGAVFWDFDENPVFIGSFTGKEIIRERDGKNADKNPNEKAGSVMGFEFKDENGDIHLLGNSYSIAKVFSGKEGKARIGQKMYIEFEGKEEQAGKQPFNRFHIQTVKE